jgi:1-phosphofructokinase family hexose kinase
MIYTITLNPSLDRTIYLESLVKSEANRIIREEQYPAGKGIDVSRVLLTLGHESIALGFLGGYTGDEIGTNIIIHCGENEEYVINAKGPVVEPIEIAELYRTIKNLHKKPAFAVISGSIPEGLSTRIYAQLTLLFESLGARVIVDTSGEPLKEAVLATPFMIKPNEKEFMALVGKNLTSTHEFVQEGKKVVQRGVEFVVISLGHRGAIGIVRDEAFLAIPPEVKAINSVGAGDSLVAGVVAGLKEGLTYEEALRLGVACGTASTLRRGTAQLSRDDIAKILKGVKLNKI